MKRILPSLFAVLAIPAAAALPGPTGFAFAKGAKFTVAGYSGSALSGFPVLVRLAAGSPVGFSYADLSSATGADLCFVDMDGTGIPFEIDTWDASGESLVWVRLPSMTNGTEFVMCWGGGADGKAVCGESPFSGYVGVWHMSEASGTVADSSGNGFAATPSGTAAAANCVAVAGPVGNGRQCSTNFTSDCLSYLSVPSYDSKSVGDTFAVSGWVSIGSGQTGNNNDARLFSRKEDYQNTHGWEVLWKTSKEIRVRGAASSDNIKVNNMDYAGKGWKHLFIVYDGKDSVFYENGVQKGAKTNGTAASDNGLPLGIGGYANDYGQQLVGSVDECRLLDAVPSADWAKAEYDSMNDAAFLTAGEAEPYGALVDLAAGVSATSVAYTSATARCSILCLGTGASSADVLVQLAATADFAAPLWATNYSVAAAGVTNFPVSGLATNTAYFLRVSATNSLGATASAGPVSFTTLSPGAPAGTAAFASAGFTTLSATCTPSSLGTGAQSAAIWLEASTNGVVAASASAPASAGTAASLTLSGLDPATTYQMHARIANDWGLETVLPLGEAATRDVPLDGDGPTWVFAANGWAVDFFFDVAEVFDGAVCTATLLYDGRTIGATNVTAAGTLSWTGVQAAVAPVPASVVVEAVVDGRTYSRTWTTLRPVDSGGMVLFVDSLAPAGGTGLRIDSPVRTIPAALALAESNATIWVRGGDGRAYGVTNNADAISIPAALEGLAIRAYGQTPGDGGRAPLSVSDTYVADGGRAHIVSNAATDVTFAGFTCSYGPRSLGYQNAPTSVKFVAVAAPRFTLADCEFFCTGIPPYAGSGNNGIVAALQVGNDYHAAAGMTVERCFFHDTIGNRGDCATAPLLVPNDTTVRECVFTNTWGIVRDPGPGKTKFGNFTFVSNVVCAGAIRGSDSYFSFANQYGSLFISGWYGVGTGAEFAYNVFIGTGDAGRGILAFTRFDGFGGSQRFHHNVVRNFPWIWGFGRGGNDPSGKTVAQFFDNVVELSEGGSVVRDEGFSGETPIVGKPLFIAGSFSLTNAIVDPGAFWGGASALAEGYDRSVVSPLDDIVLAESPDWANTNDVFHADFYRYRSRRGVGDLGVLGWRGENGEYPLWIGAKPPLYPPATLLILR